MKQKIILIAIFITLVLVGCATVPYFNVPTYQEGQDINMDENIKINIGKAYWTDIVGFQRPDAKFLIIEVFVTNIGKKSITINPPVFTAVNDQGYEYELSRSTTGFGETSFFDNLFAQHQKRLAPLVPISGYIVFDVPKDNYIMIVSQGEQDARGKLIRMKDLAKFKLTPVDK